MAESKTILILDGNSSHCLPMMQSLQEVGHSVTVVCPSKFSCGYFSRYGKKVIWPRITENENQFFRLLLDEIKTGAYDLVLGLSDASARLLSQKKYAIEEYVSTTVPDFEVFKKAADKFLTMQFCMDNGIPCPKTIDGDANLMIQNLQFPVIVKPKVGVGAVGFFIINNEQELKQRLPLLKSNYGSMIVQEFIPNENQYTVEAFCDHNSDLKACVITKKVRFFPVNGGTSSCNVTINNSEIYDTVNRLLQGIGWIGSANVDLIIDPRDNTPKVIEINPRVGATVKTAFLSGIDISEMTIKMVERKPIESKIEVPESIVMRNLVLDVLWFLFSPLKLKREGNPSFWKFFGKGIHYQNFSLDDPLPALGYLLSNILKYTNGTVVKRKLGWNERSHEIA